MTVPTVNILFSFNPEPLKLVFEENADMSIVLKKAQQDPTNLLFTNIHNNFISLEHEVAFSESPQAGGKDHQITLTFIDPEQQFEERFVAQSMSNILGSTLRLRRQISTVEDEIQEVDQQIVDLEGQIEIQKGVVAEAQKRLDDIDLIDVLDEYAGYLLFSFLAPGDVPNPQLPALKEELAQIIETEENVLQDLQDNLNAFNTELDDLLREEQFLNQNLAARLSRKMWIMYGCGEDVNDWAGPFLCYFVGANYNYTGKGARQISLTFVSNFSLFRDHDISLVTRKSTYVEGRGVIVEEPEFPTQDVFGNDINVPSAPTNIKSVHESISDTIKNYLINVKGDANVVVLLPDLDNILSEYLQNLNKTAAVLGTQLGLDDFDLGGFILGISISDGILTFPQLAIRNFLLAQDLGLTYGEKRENQTELIYDSTQLNLEEPKQIKEQFFSLAGESGKVKSTMDDLLDMIDEKSGWQLRKTFNWENNTEVIKLIKQHLMPEVDVDSPLLIVGDEILIQRFIYGDVDIENLEEAKATSKLNSVDEYLVNQGYITDIRDLINYRLAKHCFEKSVTLPDHYAFNNIDKETIQALNIPVFKSGVQNSNILDVNFNINELMFIALNAVHGLKSVHRSPNAITTFMEFEPTLEDTLDIAKWLLTNWDGDKNQPLKDIANTLGFELNLPSTEVEQAVEAVYKTLVALENAIPGSITKLDEFTADTPITNTMRSMLDLSRMSFTGVIKTLPEFSLSNTYNLFQPALLILKEARIVSKENKTIFGDIVNGVWKIFGFRHYISKGEVNSSFNIMKDAAFSAMPLSIAEVLAGNETSDDFNL